MADPPACNASPLIILGRAGQLDLLRAVYGTVVVLDAVAAEVLGGPAGDAAAIALQTEGWFLRARVPEVPAAVAAWDLGPGESEVLAWGLAHPGSEVILDDRLGRRCGRTLGIPVRGTVGIVVLAKQQGVIPVAGSVLDALRGAGLFITAELHERALRLVGE